LDIGCGEDRYLHESLLDRLFSKQKRFKVGLDIFKPYLLIKRQFMPVVLCDIRRLPVKEKSFDTVLCIETIEHLKKDDALKLILDMEKIAIKRVIITTPIGFVPVSNHWTNINKYQQHLCGFEPNEFKNMAYQIVEIYHLPAISQMIIIKDLAT